MAVQTGGSSSRKTNTARAISDLGALMSAKSEGNSNTDSQPVVVQVQAPVTPVPDSAITTASQEANLPAVETVVSPEVNPVNQAQNQEQAPKEETIMSATQNATTPAPATAATTAAAPAPAATTAAPADTTAIWDLLYSDAPAAAESTNPPTPIWGLLEGLEKPVVEENLDSLDGLRSTLSGRAERFSNLVAVTKDTVQRVDALEAKVAELQKGGQTRTIKFEHPDWKDEVVHGLVAGAAVSVGVLGIAYAFEAMFGSTPAVTTGEPAIQ